MTQHKNHKSRSQRQTGGPLTFQYPDIFIIWASDVQPRIVRKGLTYELIRAKLSVHNKHSIHATYRIIGA